MLVDGTPQRAGSPIRKTLRFGGTTRSVVSFDVFNALNSAATINQSQAYLTFLGRPRS